LSSKRYRAEFSLCLPKEMMPVICMLPNCSNVNNILK